MNTVKPRPTFAPGRKAEASRTTQPAAGPAPSQRLPGVSGDWTVVADCCLPPIRPGQPPARLPFALLHPDFGIVLVEFEPDDTADAERRVRLGLRKALDPAELSAIPVLHLRLAPERLDRLGPALDHALAKRRALGRISGGLWVQPVLMAFVDVQQPAAGRAGPRRAGPPARRADGGAAGKATRAVAWAGAMGCVGAAALALLAVETGAGRGTDVSQPQPGRALEASFADAAPVPARQVAALADAAGSPFDGSPAAWPPVVLLAAVASPDGPGSIAKAPIEPVPHDGSGQDIPAAAAGSGGAPAPDAAPAAASTRAEAPVAEPDELVAPEPGAVAQPSPAAPVPEPDDSAAPPPWTGGEPPRTATALPEPAAEAAMPAPDAVTAPEPRTVAQPSPAAPVPPFDGPLEAPDGIAAPPPWTLGETPRTATPLPMPEPEAALPGPEEVVVPPRMADPPAVPGAPSVATRDAAPDADLAVAVPPPPAVEPRPDPVAAAVAPPPVAMAPAMLAALIRRGDDMLAIGDVSAARLLYARAAAAGSGPAAIAVGRTHDPAAIARLGLRGLRPDPAAAATWYRRALALGEPEAEALLRGLPGAGR
jgi:hypothetical protein